MNVVRNPSRPADFSRLLRDAYGVHSEVPDQMKDLLDRLAVQLADRVEGRQAGIVEPPGLLVEAASR